LFYKSYSKLIYNRLFNFFDKHALITKSQYGFLKGLSTLDAVLDIVTNAYENMNNNENKTLLLKLKTFWCQRYSQRTCGFLPV